MLADIALAVVTLACVLLITDDGTIIAMGNDPAVVFVLQPTLASGTLTWHCAGMPASLVPSACR